MIFCLSRELELGSSQTFNDVISVGILASDGDQNLSDSNSGSQSSGLSEGSSHSSLESR